MTKGSNFPSRSSFQEDGELIHDIKKRFSNEIGKVEGRLNIFFLKKISQKKPKVEEQR